MKPMNEESAVFMLRRLVAATIQTVKVENTRRGLTKGAIREQAGAVNALFNALVGGTPEKPHFPLPDQLKEIIGS